MREWKKVVVAAFIALLLMPVSSAEAKTHKHAAPPVALSPPPKLIPDFPPIETSYDVYVGGIHLIAAKIWFEEVGSAYRSVVKAETTGLVGHFFPWNTILDSKGTIEGDTFKPQDFFTRDDWANKPKITRLHFDGKGGVTPGFDPPNTDKDREEVTDAQRLNSLDPVTAGLQMLGHIAVQKSCAIPVPIFDGKRRFDIIGRDGAIEDVSDDDYGVYTGKARTCHADFKMISGEWKDREHAKFWQKTETEPGREPFHIWLASVAPGLPEIPVRMESGSIAGLVIVHLTDWHYVSDADIKAESP
jgi:hypothetical protein